VRLLQGGIDVTRITLSLCLMLPLMAAVANAADKPPKNGGTVYVAGRCSAEWQKKMIAQGRDYRCKSYESLE
jgi:hypothetical protein